MSSFGIRPRFTQTLDLGLEEAQARLARAVEEGADRCEIKLFPDTRPRWAGRWRFTDPSSSDQNPVP